MDGAYGSQLNRARGSRVELLLLLARSWSLVGRGEKEGWGSPRRSPHSQAGQGGLACRAAHQAR